MSLFPILWIATAAPRHRAGLVRVDRAGDGRRQTTWLTFSWFRATVVSSPSNRNGRKPANATHDRP